MGDVEGGLKGGLAGLATLIATLLLGWLAVPWALAFAVPLMVLAYLVTVERAWESAARKVTEMASPNLARGLAIAALPLLVTVVFVASGRRVSAHVFEVCSE